MVKHKPIIISNHARDRMNLRGATEAEVKETIRSEQWTSAKRGKQRAKHRFEYGKLSPLNLKEYKFKEVEAIFADEPNEIVVVTVQVYYTNEEEVK